MRIFKIDHYAMTNRRGISSVQSTSPVDGLLIDRLSVIARNRGMGGRRLGPIQVLFLRRKFRTAFHRELRIMKRMNSWIQKSYLEPISWRQDFGNKKCRLYIHTGNYVS